MPVYFIQNGLGGEIKIGFTAGNPHARLASFRTGNPRPLDLLVTIPGGATEEAALHERFKDLRCQGEWFRPDARLLGFIEGLVYAHPVQPQAPLQGPDLRGLTVEQLEVIDGYLRARMASDDWANTTIPYNSATETAHLARRVADFLESGPALMSTGTAFLDGARVLFPDAQRYAAAAEVEEILRVMAAHHGAQP